MLSETTNWRYLNQKHSNNPCQTETSNGKIDHPDSQLFDNSGGARVSDCSGANTLLESNSVQDDHLNHVYGKQNTNEISCWYTNPTSLNNKMAEFTCCIYTDKPDLIFIAETTRPSHT
jgi:hypothetical protein